MFALCRIIIYIMQNILEWNTLLFVLYQYSLMVRCSTFDETVKILITNMFLFITTVIISAANDIKKRLRILYIFTQDII